MSDSDRDLKVDRGLFWAGAWLSVAYFPLTIFVAPRLDTPGSEYFGFSIVLFIGLILLVASLLVGRFRRARTPPTATRPTGRGRRIDAAFGIALAVVLGGTVLIGTGVVPAGLYPASGATWSLAMNPCGVPPNEGSNSFSATFPIWSTVNVESTDQGQAVFLMSLDGSSGLIGQIAGYGGLLSFVSNGQPILLWVFDPYPANGTDCDTTIVSVTVDYAISA